jgi:hypothetical protein
MDASAALGSFPPKLGLTRLEAAQAIGQSAVTIDRLFQAVSGGESAFCMA